MLTKITIESFKSLEEVEVELGQVNVFVGANGSGKSNFLEAIGVLSAAASGRVDDEALMRRGVRPGLPLLYKSAFRGGKRMPHIVFAAESASAAYKVSLYNPLSDPKPAWRYHTESWHSGTKELAGRSHRMRLKPNPEAGFAALKAVDLNPADPALALLDILRGYAIYEPNTPTLRGLIPEVQPREPVGLSGGGLAQAIHSLIQAARRDEKLQTQFEEFAALIDWASSIDAAFAHKLPLSPSAASSKEVVRFVDRFMRDGRNALSGADASEGALYVLFAAVLSLDERAPSLLAIDNADHGLNPRLARALMGRVCDCFLKADRGRQLLLTSHSPQVLDGLPLQNSRVRLFTVSRTNLGRTTISRVEINERLLEMARQGWTLSRLWVMGHIGGVPDV
jgi:energy-coupling factor transporter ATP-binding protein EcfA2